MDGRGVDGERVDGERVDGEGVDGELSGPIAARERVIRSAHGVQRVDDYAWLANPGERTLAHLRAERAHYERSIAHLRPLRQVLLDEMVTRTPRTESSVRWRRGGSVYYTERADGEEYAATFQIPPGATEPRLVLDPNQLASDGGHLGLGVVEVSPDGALLAYSIDRTGDEVFELRFRDLATGRDLPDLLPRTYRDGPWVRDGGSWTPDSAGYVYLVPDDAGRPDRVQLHLLGTDPATDPTLLVEPDQRFELDVPPSRDGRWIVITAASRDTTEVHLVDGGRPQLAPRLVAPRRAGVSYTVEVLPGGWFGDGDDELLVVTDDGRAEFRLLKAPLPPPTEDGPVRSERGPSERTRAEAKPNGPAGFADAWREVAAGLAAGERLETVTVLAGHVVLHLRRDGEQLLRLLDRALSPSAQPAREVTSSLRYGSLELWHADDPNARELLLVEQNLVTPQTISRLDPATGAREVLWRNETPHLDLDDYVTERLSARSADGTAVPVTIARRHDLAPGSGAGVLLHGYGAYEDCEWPQFDATVFSLLDRGLVHAIAHVRGGGELGRHWWQQGRLRAKQHTFDDFIAARHALVEAGWAGPFARPGGGRTGGRGDGLTDDRGGVVCRGLSAGGLLMGAVFSQAPRAWAAVIAEVPFVDVVTTMSDPTIPLTINEWQEWGDPITDPGDFMAMLAYSPYDNPPAPVDRPPLLVTGAVHDARVLVHEPAKWVALLRERDGERAMASRAPLLFRVETGAGAHSGPTGRLSRLDYEAELAAWALWVLDHRTR